MTESRTIISPWWPGLRANIVGGEWSADILEELQGRDIRALGLCAIDWPELTALAPIAPNILELSLISADTSGEGLAAFSNLVALSIDTPLKPAIDISALRHLERARLFWTKDLNKRPINSQSLERLEILHFDAPDCSVLEGVPALTALDIRQGNLRSLAGIGRLTSLKHLSLTSLRSLSDISDLCKAENLTRLEISQCHKLSDFHALSGLRRLAHLEIDMLGSSQHDLSWMANLAKVEHICNGTQVESIDWAMILSLPKLRQFSTHTHPGYKISDDELLRIASSLGRGLSEIKRYPNKLGQGIELFLSSPG